MRCDPEALKPENLAIDNKIHSPVAQGKNRPVGLSVDVELPKDSLYTLNPPTEEDSSCGCVLQLTATCNWVNKKAHHNYGAFIPLVFYMPFKCKYDIYASGDISFVRLTIQSTAPLPIRISDMKIKQTTLLKPVATRDQLECTLHPGDMRILLYQVCIVLVAWIR